MKSMKFEPKVIVNRGECYESYKAADFDHLIRRSKRPKPSYYEDSPIIGRWQKGWDVYDVFSCSYLYCILYTEVSVEKICEQIYCRYICVFLS